MKVTYVSEKGPLLREFGEDKFSKKNIHEPGGVQCQNGHKRENQLCSKGTV